MYCKNCGKDILENAEICMSCGVRNMSIKRHKDSGLAAMLSFFIPGAGQIYNGDGKKGVTLLILSIISYIILYLSMQIWLVLVGLPAFLTMLILWIYSIYDAYNTTKKIRG